MRAVIQRVTRGAVTIEGEEQGRIAEGLVVLLGVGSEDTIEDARYLADKIVNLRIFDDQEGRMNLSALDRRAELLVISQFTLYGDCRKGRRPSYASAAPPEVARELYEQFVEIISAYGLKTKTGRFQATMLVDISNHGPVTILLDSKKCF